MLGSRSTRFWSFVLCLTATLVSSGLKTADAQPQRSREHVYLPPAFAGTPHSFQIQAEAQYLAALGDYEESLAVAREIHAEAYAKELENWEDYVDRFFRRREKNREWRKKERTSYLEHLGKYDDSQKERITKHPDAVKASNVAEGLNWLLKELSGPTLAYDYVPRQGTTANSKLNVKLSPEAVPHLRFTDGEMIFSAVGNTILDARWPLALRAENFAPLCNQFESARNQLVEEFRTQGKVTVGTHEKLIRSVNDLLVALEEAYPKGRRTAKTLNDNNESYLRYSAARRFLMSLSLQAHRAAHTVDPAIFDGTLRFGGDTVIDLVRHMDRHGLNFAPPEPGDEGAYRGLFNAMRRLYLVWIGTDDTDSFPDSPADS